MRADECWDGCMGGCGAAVWRGGAGVSGVWHCPPTRIQSSTGDVRVVALIAVSNVFASHAVLATLLTAPPAPPSCFPPPHAAFPHVLGIDYSHHFVDAANVRGVALRGVALRGVALRGGAGRGGAGRGGTGRGRGGGCVVVPLSCMCR